MVVAAGISAVATIGSAAFGAREAGRTARRQAATIRRSTEASIEEQRRQFDIAQELTAPRREAETAALGQLRNILGIGDEQFDISGLQIPGQQFAIAEGQRAIERSATARGGLISGGTVAALQGRAQGIAQQNFLSNFLNPLTQLATGQAGQQAGQRAFGLGANIGGALQQAGINRANIIGTGAAGQSAAIQGGLSNLAFLGLSGARGGFGGGGGNLTPIPFNAARAAQSGQAGANILFGGR